MLRLIAIQITIFLIWGAYVLDGLVFCDCHMVLFYKEITGAQVGEIELHGRYPGWVSNL